MIGLPLQPHQTVIRAFGILAEVPACEDFAVRLHGDDPDLTVGGPRPRIEALVYGSIRAFCC